jgi:hypothetical protein
MGLGLTCLVPDFAKIDNHCELGGGEGTGVDMFGP